MSDEAELDVKHFAFTFNSLLITHYFFAVYFAADEQV
jgi:hypothetical protein